MPENTLFTCRTEEDGINLFNPSHPLWSGEHVITIDHFSTGSSALAEKGYGWTNLTQVSSAWNQSAIFFYFECWHSWHTMSGSESETSRSNTSVVEVITLLLRPEGCEDFYQISVDSHGHHSAAHVFQAPADTDLDWTSEADVSVLVSDQDNIWRLFLRLPFEPMIEASDFGHTPKVGDAWRLNLTRTAGPENDREFLSWRPSCAALTDPALFGHLIFLEDA